MVFLLARKISKVFYRIRFHYSFQDAMNSKNLTPEVIRVQRHVPSQCHLVSVSTSSFSLLVLLIEYGAILELSF